MAAPVKASETGLQLALCSDCYRVLKTQYAKVGPGRPLAECVEPPRWGVP
jgi:hypothetical protein